MGELAAFTLAIFEACREGVVLAATVGRPVAFEFNGAVAVCRTGGDPEAIAKAWWKRAYGKTYEESMRDRLTSKGERHEGED